MTQWKYYNHAMIPDQDPHLPVELSAVENGSVFTQKNGKRALFARWTEGWDLHEETHWWYVICKAPFDINKLSKKSRENIKSSLHKCSVCRIDPYQYAEDLWRVYNEAIMKYKNFYSCVDKSTFIHSLSKDKREYWGGFIAGTKQLIGYKVCSPHTTYVGFDISKYSVPYLKLRVSDALTYTCLDYYLNQQHKEYVSSGSRTVNHTTNAQQYLMEHFNYTKSYCKLHIKYRLGIDKFIKIIYPFRKILGYFDGIRIVHQLNAVLKMEEICRTDKGVKCTD